jgi:integrase
VEAEYRLRKRRNLRRVLLARKHILAAFPDAKATDVKGADLLRYASDRQAAGLADATIAYDLAILHHGYRLAVKLGTLDKCPVFTLPTPQDTRTGFFEGPEHARVRDALPEALRGIAVLAFYSGWRVPSEIVPLTSDRVDLRAGTLRLDAHTSKNGEARTLTFGNIPELADMLRRQRLYADSFELTTGRRVAHVFHRAGKPVKDFYVTWRKACQEAGVPGRLLHDFRRSAAQNLVRPGVPEQVAMRVTGHKTRSVFARYNIVSTVDLEDATAKLAAHMETLATG